MNQHEGATGSTMGSPGVKARRRRWLQAACAAVKACNDTSDLEWYNELREVCAKTCNACGVIW